MALDKSVKRRTSWLLANTFANFVSYIFYTDHYMIDSGYLRSSLIGKCICNGSLNRFKSSSTCARLSLRALYRFTSSPIFCACLWNPNKVWRSKTSGKMYSCEVKSEIVKQIRIISCV